MPETIEFDVVHEYSLFEVGITLKTILRNGDLSVYFDAKIDTGSTFCIFSRHHGEGLGLEIESGIPVNIGTATGSFPAYGHRVEMEVLGLKFDSTVYFAEGDYFDRDVLGRIGWLDRVKLGLVEREGKLFLSEY